ncbi:hypothetical protein A4V82_003841 [Escherichia coli]|nr:hypothetical protein [Escherichia coli]
MSEINYQALREAAVAIETVATPQKLLAFRMKATPQVVLALLDELEAAKSKLNEQREYYEGVIADGSKRIAELSASHSKLRDTMAGIHNTIRMDGGYTPLAAILNAAKRAYEESASAAGIKEESE